MKKRMTILCAALCLLLAGCGGGESSAEPRSFEKADLETVLAADVFSEELESVDAELICMQYGLDSGLVTECAGYLSTGATAEEAVYFKAADANAAETIKAACEMRVEDQIMGYEDYIPGEVPKLENAVLAVRGTTVLLVVADDAAGAAAAVDGLN